MSKADLAAERKTQIINATIECIARFGYHNFSMQDVAKVADVSKGIIHYYFLNKEDLMIAVLERVAGDIEGVLAGTSDQTSPADRLRAIIKICFRIVQEKKEYYSINIDFWTQINQKEKVRQAVAKHYTKFRSAIASVIQEGIAAGVFKQSDVQDTSSIIIAIVDGIGLQWLFDNNVLNYAQVTQKCEDMILGIVVK